MNDPLFSVLRDNCSDSYPPIYLLKGKPKLDPTPRQPKFPFFFWLLSGIIAIFVIALIVNQPWTFEEAVVQKADGTYELSANRQAKRDREIERFHNAEQYVLLARENGWYLCHSCIEANSIYLYVGEVWKYGITTKRQTGRYPQGLPDYRLQYVVQLRGDLTACSIAEKQQIYAYPLLVENIKRTNRLFRPPGNKQDN